MNLVAECCEGGASECNVYLFDLRVEGREDFVENGAEG